EAPQDHSAQKDDEQEARGFGEAASLPRTPPFPRDALACRHRRRFRLGWRPGQARRAARLCRPPSL
ncbi:MAG: hypothetical protein AVDCRST_MAG23-1973, partial [uncultured Sphingosinicella sp.]